jgi:hypothetical protein
LAVFPQSLVAVVLAEQATSGETGKPVMVYHQSAGGLNNIGLSIGANPLYKKGLNSSLDDSTSINK